MRMQTKLDCLKPERQVCFQRPCEMHAIQKMCNHLDTHDSHQYLSGTYRRSDTIADSSDPFDFVSYDPFVISQK
jgi:hypothetical protein